MKRVLRWAFNFAAAVSALLFVATCVLWMRSYHLAELLTWRREDAAAGLITQRTYTAFSSHGGLRLAYEAWLLDDPLQIEQHRPVPSSFDRFASPNPAYPPEIKRTADPDEVSLSFLGLDVYGLRASPPSSRAGQLLDGVLTLPYWALLMVFGFYPALRIFSKAAATLRRRFGRVGLCPLCGYDLRATPGRCPECGAMPSKKATI